MCVVGGSSAWGFLSNFLQGRELMILNAQLFHIHCINLTSPNSMVILAGKHTPSLSKCAASFLASTIFFRHSYIH